MGNGQLSWSNQLFLAKAEMILWRKIAVGMVVLVGILVMTIGGMSYQYFTKINTQKLLLVAPTLGVGPVEVDANAQITEGIMKVIAKRVVELNENWSYETIGDNFNELYQFYYDQRLVELTKSNLLSSDRIKYVKENRVISVFSVDWKRSRFAWCSKLMRACSLVVGTRKLFVNNNEPFKEKEVAYLIFAQAIFPNAENPHAVRIRRLKVDDASESPYQNLLNQFEMAIKGVSDEE